MSAAFGMHVKLAWHARVIDVRGMRMNYGPVEAVSGINLEVHLGEVFAFLGPNGAGKTTTVEILEGLRRRSAGEVSVLGEDPRPRRGAMAGADRRGAAGVRARARAHRRGVRGALCRLLPRSRPVRETLDLVGLADRPRCGAVSSPAASAGGSTWRSHSSAIRSSCSWTSRPRVSTPRRAGPPGRSSRDSVIWGRRSS